MDSKFTMEQKIRSSMINQGLQEQTNELTEQATAQNNPFVQEQIHQPAAATMNQGISALQQADPLYQKKEMSEQRRTFMTKRDYDFVTDQAAKQLSLIQTELCNAIDRIHTVYQYMDSLTFGSMSFNKLKRSVGKLIALYKNWDNRVQDPDACAALNIKTANDKFRELSGEVMNEATAFLASHKDKKRQGDRDKRRLEIVEKLSFDLDTVCGMSQSHDYMSREFVHSTKDLLGYTESQVSDELNERLKKEDRKRFGKKTGTKFVKAYTADGNFAENIKHPEYRCMNQLLRGKWEWNQFDEEHRKILEKDIEGLFNAYDLPEAVLKENTLLFRGTDLSEALKENGLDEKSPEQLKGKIIMDKGFMSTSRAEDIAQKFAQNDMKKGFLNLVDKDAKNFDNVNLSDLSKGFSMCEIVTRKGARGLDVASGSLFAKEKEILFKPSTKMVIIEAKRENYSVTFTDMDIAAYCMRSGRTLQPDLVGKTANIPYLRIKAEIR